MNEPVSDPSVTDWEAVMAEAFAASGGPLTADEREWAASTFGLSFDAPTAEPPRNETRPARHDVPTARQVDVHGRLLP